MNDHYKDTQWQIPEVQHQFKARFLMQYIREGFLLKALDNEGNFIGGNAIDCDDFWGWLDSDESDYPFSFKALCSSLGYDAKTLKGLLLYQKRKLNRS